MFKVSINKKTCNSDSLQNVSLTESLPQIGDSLTFSGTGWINQGKILQNISYWNSRNSNNILYFTTRF